MTALAGFDLFVGSEAADFVRSAEKRDVDSNNSSLEYETLAVLQSNDQENGGSNLHGVVGTSTATTMVLASGSSVMLFTKEVGAKTFALHGAVDAKSTVELVALNAEGTFAVCALKSGSLLFIEIASKMPFNYKLLKDVTAPCAFRSVLFNPAKPELAGESVLVVSGENMLFKFSNVDLCALFDALRAKDMATLQAVNAAMKVTNIDLALIHADGVASVQIGNCEVRETLLVAGGGACSLSVWSPDREGVWSSEDTISSNDKIVKMRSCGGSPFMLTLNDKKALTLWDSEFLIKIASWTELAVRDFAVVPWSTALAVAVLSDTNARSSTVTVYSLPKMEVQYRLKVSPQAQFVDVASSGGSLFVVDPTSASGTSVIEIREAAPTSLFLNLIAQNKFAEAEAFAAEHGLSKAQVARARAAHALATAAVVVDATADTMEPVLGALRQRDLVKDLPFVVSFCLEAVCSTSDATRALVQHALDAARDAQDDALICQAADALSRLATFVLITDDDFNAALWQRFRTANILRAITTLIAQNKLQAAIIVWRRHQNECSSLEQVNEILARLPSDAPIDVYVPWLAEEVFPSLTVAERTSQEPWVLQRAAAVELNEGVPDGALRVSRALSAAVAKGSFTTPKQTVELILGDVSNLARDESSLGRVICQLEDLVYLRTQHGYVMSLSAYCQESPTAIAIMMIERVAAPELLSMEIEKHVKPYIARHSLSCDRLLCDYVVEWMDNMVVGMSSTLSAMTSEQRVLAIIACIETPQDRINASMELLRRTAIPWGADIDKLMADSLTWITPPPTEMEEQQRLMRLRRMLVNYGIKSFNVSETGRASALLRFILARTDMPCAMDDALQVIEAFAHLSKPDAYVFRLQRLILDHQVSQAQEFFSKAPAGLAPAVGQETIIWLCDRVNDAELDDADRREATTVACGILTTLNNLPKDADAVDSFYLKIDDMHKMFVALQALQQEYDLLLTVDQFNKIEERRSVLARYLAAFFTDAEAAATAPETAVREVVIAKPVTKAPAGEENATTAAATGRRKKVYANTSSSISKLYRLAELVNIPVDEMRCSIARHAAKRGDAGRAVAACREMYQRVPTASTASMLVQVAKDLMEYAQNHPELFSISLRNNKEIGNVEAARTRMRIPYHARHLLETALTICPASELPATLQYYKICELVSQVLSQCDTGTPANASAAGLRATAAPQASSSGAGSSRAGGSSSMSGGSAAQSRPKADTFASVIYADTFKESGLVLNTGRAMDLAMRFYAEQMAPPSKAPAKEVKADTSGKGKGGAVEPEQTERAARLVVDLLRSNQSCQPALCFALQIGDHNMITTLLDSLLNKVFRTGVIDHAMALGYMGCMSERAGKDRLEAAFNAYKRAMSAVQSDRDYSRLQRIGCIGVDAAVMWKQRPFELDCRNLIRNARWWIQFQLLDIPFDDVSFRKSTRGEYQRTFIAPLLEKSGMDIAATLEFTREYEIEDEVPLLTYIRKLLLSPVVPKPDYQDKIACVLDQIDNRAALLAVLRDCLPRINERDYDRLQYVYTLIADNDKADTVAATSLTVLAVLQAYRITPGAEAARRAETAVGSVVALSLEESWTATRIPFFALMKDPWAVISPHLSASTVRRLIGLAAPLGLPTDQFYVTLVRSMLGRCDLASLKEARNLLQHVKDSRAAVETAERIIMDMPLGADKIQALKMAVQMANKWQESASPAEKAAATEAANRLVEVERRASTEFTLRSHGIEHLTTHLDKPRELVLQLYEQYAAAAYDAMTRSTSLGSWPSDLHGTVEVIGRRYGLEVDKLRQNIIGIWLTDGDSKPAKDADTSVLSAANREKERVVAKRIACLLKIGSVEKNVAFLLNYAFQQKSLKITSMARARALQAVLYLANDDVIEKMFKRPVAGVRERLMGLLYATEFETLRLPQSLEEIESADKEALARGLWRTHRHSAAVVQVIISLCLDHAMYDVSFWEEMLSDMAEMGSNMQLLNLLDAVSRVPVLAQLPTIAAVWTRVMDAGLLALENRVSQGLHRLHAEDGPQFPAQDVALLTQAVSLLVRCPCLFSLGVAGVASRLRALGLTRLAARCLLAVPSSRDRAALVGEMLNGGAAAVLLEECNVAAETGAMTGVAGVLLDELAARDAFAAVIETSHWAGFVSHLIGTDNLTGITHFLVAGKRMAQLWQLVASHRALHEDEDLGGMRDPAARVVVQEFVRAHSTAQDLAALQAQLA